MSDLYLNLHTLETQSHYISQQTGKHDRITFIAVDNIEAKAIYNILLNFLPPDYTNVAYLLSRTTNMADRTPMSIEHISSIKNFNHITKQNKYIAVVSADALCEPILDGYDNFPIKHGQGCERANLITYLANHGYKRQDYIDRVGHFAIRGSILDIWVPELEAVRVDFFGDEVESIRYFDINSQKTHGEKIESIEITTLLDIGEINLPNKHRVIEDIRARLHGTFNILPQATYDRLAAIISTEMEKLGNDEHFIDMMYYLPVYAEHGLGYNYPADIVKIGKIYTGITDKQLAKAINDKYENELSRFEENIDSGLTLPIPFIIKNSEETLKKLPEITSLLPFGESSLYQNVTQFNSDKDKILDFIKEKQLKSIHIDTSHTKWVERLIQSDPAIHVSVKVSSNNLSRGFETLKYILITDRELFGYDISGTAQSNPNAPEETYEEKLEIYELNYGDIVVHQHYGIAQFVEITQREFEGFIREYILLTFKDDDKLYLPVDSVGLLKLYKGNKESIELSRLGGKEWEKTKAKARTEAKKLSDELLQAYAARAASTGFACPPDESWQFEMESDFIYTETPDQVRSLTDIKADMESPIPMDRLLCGDVGFGKTEVALRAAFKMIVSGQKQVAMVVPTTILARQHYKTISNRFAPYGIKIAVLTGHTPLAETKKIIEELAEHKLDMVIGTHSIIAKRVHFGDIGLFIVDEEHKFGVAQKDTIKEKNPSIDILSLSATPIPRSLNLALSSLKSISLITTPPMKRLPIQTVIAPQDEEIVRKAVLFELNRGGQVFYLHNNIMRIDREAAMIHELVPQARIGVIHARMERKDIDNVMSDLSDGKYNVLVATTIIEAGIDIPSANTIIITNADKLGLAQLYQLRGRVGRSPINAFAYCLYNRELGMSEDGKRRLEALQEFSQLGSGYSLAIRDLEIRGGGDIIGPRQKGIIDRIGLELYADILAQANDTGGEAKHNIADISMDINADAYIPEEWAGSLNNKISAYMELAKTGNEYELDMLRSTWEDRYGDIIPPVERLFELTRLKLDMSTLHLTKIKGEGANAVLMAPIPEPIWHKIRAHLPNEDRYLYSKVSDGIKVNGTNQEPDKLIALLRNLLSAIKKVQGELG